MEDESEPVDDEPEPVDDEQEPVEHRTRRGCTAIEDEPETPDAPEEER